MKSDKFPIFIVGCENSGTSLLINILGAHSRLCAIPFESRFALKWDEPCPALHAFFTRCENFTRRMRKIRWVEKTPRHIYRIKEILGYFPMAKILLMLRDGRDVACSIQDQARSLESGIDQWVEDNQAGEPFWKHANVQVVRYEALVAEFEKTLRGIFEFLGETFEESVMRYHETPRYYFVPRIEKPAHLSGDNHFLYRNWQMNQPLFDGRGEWQRLTEPEKQLIKEKAGKTLIRYGYATDLNW